MEVVSSRSSLAMASHTLRPGQASHRLITPNTSLRAFPLLVGSHVNSISHSSAAPVVISALAKPVSRAARLGLRPILDERRAGRRHRGGLGSTEYPGLVVLLPPLPAVCPARRTEARRRHRRRTASRASRRLSRGRSSTAIVGRSRRTRGHRGHDRSGRVLSSAGSRRAILQRPPTYCSSSQSIRLGRVEDHSSHLPTCMVTSAPPASAPASCAIARLLSLSSSFPLARSISLHAAPPLAAVR